MRILHYYPENPQHMVSQYVSTLCESMGLEATNDTTTDGTVACQKLCERHYDILHLHGCWRNSSYKVVNQAFKTNTRLVVSPHGQLQPWMVGEKYWEEKLPKKLLYQRNIVSRSYAVIVQGKMEEECMQKLAWNKRLVIIRNCLITQSISQKEMARQTFLVYRKVMDSNTLELMTDSTKTTLRQLIKAGITGDERWLYEPCVTIEDEEQWRMLLCHVYQEQIEEVVRRGMRILHLEAPDINMKRIDCYLPDDYQPSESIEHAIGIKFATENDRLLATFRHLRKLQLNRRLTRSHLIELDRELRQHNAVEDLLCESLNEHHLYPFAARLMQLASELTGLDEGYMPMSPLDDRLTRKIRKQINNHLTI